MSPRSRYRGRLFTAVAGIALAGLALALAAVWGMRAVADEHERVVAAAFQRVAEVQRLRAIRQDQIAASRAYLLTGDRELLDERNARAAAFEAALAELSVRLRGRDDAARLTALRSANERLQSESLRAFDLRSPEGDNGALWTAMVRPHQEAVRAALEALLDAAETRLRAVRTTGHDASRRAETLLVLVAAVVLTLAGVLAWIVARTIRRAFVAAERVHEERMFQFLERLPVGVFVLRADGKPYYANREAEQLLGRGVVPHARPEDLAATYAVYVAGTTDLYPTPDLPVMRALAGETVAINDLEIRRPGDLVPLQVNAAPIRDADGQIRYAICAFQDVRDLRRLALQDNLTKLANRNALLEAFGRLRPLCERRQQPLSIAIIDFDRFKKINDELGHAMGDEVLARSSQRIVGTLRETDHVGRWGGEEIVVIMPDTHLAGAQFALDKARLAVRAQEFEAPGGHRFRVTFSAGVVELTRGESLEDAVKRADQPLYRAKQDGRDRVLAA